MTEQIAAELAEHLAETFPHLDVASILRKGAEALEGEDEMAELGEFLQTTADQIPTERTPTMPTEIDAEDRLRAALGEQP